MAIQVPLQPSGDIEPTRYTETRAPQFIGGASDPTTGNMIPASRSDAAQGTVKGNVVPEPAKPGTRLGTIGADTPPAPNLGKAALGVTAPYVGAQVGSQVGAGAGFGEALEGTISHLGEATKNLISGGSSTVPLGSTAPAAEFGTLAGSSTLGGAAGAGIGTAVVGALTGQKPKEYLPAAAGSAVGFYIGTAVGGPIGGIAGSFLGSMFCHVAGTMIRMEDGSLKAIENLDFGDRALLGGAVIGAGKVMATDLYEYRGTVVNGRHAVFEDGKWLRVKDSAKAKAVDGGAVVYPVVTEQHLLVCENYICADLAEMDEDIGADGRLARLNAAKERNRRLLNVQFILDGGWQRDPHAAAA